MENETRKLFNSYKESIEKENGVAPRTGAFAAVPAAEQRAVATAKESSELLKTINMVGVRLQEGQAVGVSISGRISGRTNTAVKARTPRNVINLAGLDTYNCVKTDFDVALPYATFDGWAQFKDFQARIDNAIGEQQALDRLMIGFNGTHVAADTDAIAYPLLQDVNIGWLEKIRTKAAGQVKLEGATAGKVTIGAGGDHKNLDALVYAAIQMLAPHHRKRPDLVVLIDRDLLHSKSLGNVENATDNISELALNRILSSGLVAGIPHRDTPFFPDGCLLVTSLANLSIYYQKSTMRRFIKENPAIEQVEDYQSLNEAYVVEDFDLVALVQNIEFA